LDLLDLKIYIGQYILTTIVLPDYDSEQTACKNSGGSTVGRGPLRHEKCAPGIAKIAARSAHGESAGASITAGIMDSARIIET
jgi:hypothetical protein